jgi:iron(III) transport system ATP-binding protein
VAITGQRVVSELNLQSGMRVTLAAYPSGCGKTTTWCAIAGFEPVQQGETGLACGGHLTCGLYPAPGERRIGRFQDYALFHLTVAQNVPYSPASAVRAGHRRYWSVA